MTRNRAYVTRAFCWAAILGVFIFGIGFGQDTPPATDAGQFVWIEPGPTVIEYGAMIRVSCGKAQGDEGPVVFDCAFQTEEPVNEAMVRVTITNPDGHVVEQKQVPVMSDKDVSTCRLEWDASQAGPGDYRARFEMLRRSGFTIAERNYVLRKVDVKWMDEQRIRAEATLRTVGSCLEQENIPATAGAVYTRARFALAMDCLDQATRAMNEQQWPLAAGFIRHLTVMADALPAQLAFGHLVPELAEPLPVADLAKLRIRDGGFYVDERPVFLFGMRFSSLRRYGFNLAVFHVGPADTLAGPDTVTDIAATLNGVFKKAGETQVAVMLSLAPQRLAPWAVEQWPHLLDSESGQADLAQPEARALLQRHIETLGPCLSQQPMLAALCLFDQPAFKFTGEAVRQGFLAMVKERYADRHAVNESWKALFADLNELEIGWNKVNPRYQESPAYQYDWETYHERLGTDFIQATAELTRKQIPDVPLMIGTASTQFELGESEHGIDHEAIAGLMDLSGCCASNTCLDSFYSMGYPQESLIYTFLRSLAPDSPVVNFDDEIMPGNPEDTPYTPAYVRTVVWEGVMAGLNGSALAVNQQIENRPDCLDAYITAALDVNRLAPIVAAFQRTPAEIAVIWSPSSKIYGNGVPHLSSARFAFEGCSFAGYKVRFISEAQCVASGLNDVKILVIPDTPAITDLAFTVVKDYVQRGGIVVRTTLPVTFDERGRSRRDIIPNTSRTVLLRGENLPTEYLHSVDAVLTFGGLAPVPRIVNQFGYPIEGVKSFYAALDGQGYLFVINLRKTAVQCSLKSEIHTGRDVIRGRDLVFPAQIEPLDPMLIRLDPATGVS